MSAAETEFARLLDAAAADTRVVGLVLGGSRGKDPAYITPLSDYDAYVIVVDEATRDEFLRWPLALGAPRYPVRPVRSARTLLVRRRAPIRGAERDHPGPGGLV